MKRWITGAVSLLFALSALWSAGAEPITDITEDVDKHIATGITVGEQLFTISATFTPAGPGAPLGEGIGFYYQNGEGTPPQSFYRFVLWRDNGSDAGSDRLDFYCEKQYNDKNVKNVPASINGISADDPAINTEYRYISVDWGWYASADAAFKMDVTVDPATQKATAVLTGIPSGNKAVLEVDLTQKAQGEKTAGVLTGGEVFIWKTKCIFSNFSISGADAMGEATTQTVPTVTTTIPPATTTSVALDAPTTANTAAAQKVGFSGVLKNTAGEVMADTLLIVDQSDGQQVSTMTDASGQFSFTNVPEGKTTIAVRDNNGNVLAAKQITLRAGETAAVSADGAEVTTAQGAVGLTLIADTETYGITVSLNTEVSVPTMTTTASKGNNEDGKTDLTILWVVLGVAAVAIAAVVVILVLKKKKAFTEK